MDVRGDLDGTPQPGYYYQGDLNVDVTLTHPEWDALFGEFGDALNGLDPEGDNPTWKGTTFWWITRLGMTPTGITTHAL
jgi:hypothetical protein